MLRPDTDLPMAYSSNLLQLERCARIVRAAVDGGHGDVAAIIARDSVRAARPILSYLEWRELSRA